MAKSGVSHDAAYKALFSNPEMVKSLLLDFIPEDFIREFDFDSLERCSGSHATADLRERRSDLIWRLRWRDTWCYVYILTEFQSSQHHWMALRILTYAALLWEDLVRTGAVNAGQKLPPVFPIVLYNGDAPWTAARDLSELVQSLHPGLDQYQPRHKYCVLDEKRVPREALERAEGGAAYVLRVEQARELGDIFKIAVDFDARIWGENFSSTHIAMLEWMEQKMRRMSPGWETGKTEAFAREESMLAELIARHKQRYIDEGFARGEAKGFALGVAQGEACGMRTLVRSMLRERFGALPEAWDAAIDSMHDPEVMGRLSGAIYRVKNADEFDRLLKKLG